MNDDREAELRRRILGNLAVKPNDDGVVIAWQGYLAAVAEWGVVDLHAHARLVQLLPPGIGIDETEIILLGVGSTGTDRDAME